MIALTDNQSDGVSNKLPAVRRQDRLACHTYDRLRGFSAPSYSVPSATSKCTYGKTNMPPVTRTQIRSLPRGGDGISTAQVPSNSPATVTPRHSHTKKFPTQLPKLRARKSQPVDSTESLEGNPISPPRFTINLSLPPSQRYAEVCTALRDEMRGLQSLFDEVVGGFLPSWVPSVVLNWVAWALLWRVCDGEEDAELDVSFDFISTLLPPTLT
jgi:hypothetical protein